MFIVVPFISSTGLVVVAEANLRCGNFLPEKVVVTVLVVFLSFWFWLPEIPWVFMRLNDSAAFSGLIMHCLFVIGTWKRLVFDFSFFSVESCHFMCLSVMRFFSLQVVPFLISVWLILYFWCAHFYSFIQFYCGSGRCTSEFALDCFCLNKVITNW